MKRTILLAFASMTLLVSCGPSREKEVKQITSMEKSLFAPGTMSFDQKKADSLVGF